MVEKKTLYEQIIEHFIDKINNRELLPGDRLPTELEISEDFNVSRITAKRALEELRKAGLIYRKKGQGSFVNSHLQQSRNSMHKIISIIIPGEGSEGRLIDYIRGASQYLSDKGYFLTVHCTDGDQKKEKEFLIKLPKEGVSGIMYYPNNTASTFDILNILCMEEYPIVTIDKYYDQLPLSNVVSDNFDGGYKAVEHLISLGHSEIAFIASASLERVSSVRERFLGYCKAIKDNSLHIKDDLIFTSYLDELGKLKNREEQKDYVKNILSTLKDKGATAIVAENDYLAAEIVSLLPDIGIDFPSQMSIVGFDNVDVLKNIHMPITTIEQNFSEIGESAAKILVEMIEKNKYVNEKVVVPVKLIERDSTVYIK